MLTGILYFANRSGILQFDGRTWTMVPTPAPVYAISIAHDGTIYAAGSMGFGRIGLNQETNKPIFRFLIPFADWDPCLPARPGESRCIS